MVEAEIVETAAGSVPRGEAYAGLPEPVDVPAPDLEELVR
jgi:hypothetical protein